MLKKKKLPGVPLHLRISSIYPANIASAPAVLQGFSWPPVYPPAVLSPLSQSRYRSRPLPCS
uniref:Uncharacterized protein n=1 Tax=Anguilla anguilla TaxID=7936 RepID=A0A0E9WUK8_ANGAN